MNNMMDELEKAGQEWDALMYVVEQGMTQKPTLACPHRQPRVRNEVIQFRDRLPEHRLAAYDVVLHAEGDYWRVVKNRFGRSDFRLPDTLLPVWLRNLRDATPVVEIPMAVFGYGFSIDPPPALVSLDDPNAVRPGEET